MLVAAVTKFYYTKQVMYKSCRNNLRPHHTHTDTWIHTKISTYLPNWVTRAERKFWEQLV